MNLSDLSRKDQVLAVLQQAHGEWVNGTELANEQVGGSEGLKRLRELRDEGFPISRRAHPDENRDIHQYRLDPRTLVVPDPKPWTVDAVPIPTQWVCEQCGTRVNEVDQIVLGGYGLRVCPWQGCPSRTTKGGNQQSKPKQAYFKPVTIRKEPTHE